MPSALAITTDGGCSSVWTSTTLPSVYASSRFERLVRWRSWRCSSVSFGFLSWLSSGRVAEPDIGAAVRVTIGVTVLVGVSVLVGVDIAAGASVGVAVTVGVAVG